jgi:hypothetical protein
MWRSRVKAVDVPQLLKMPQAQLDELYRSSPAGDVPRGEGQGTLLVAPGTKLSRVAARFVHHVAWQGKVFDPERGELRNQVSPIGIKAVGAKVYRGPSWFDGNECIVLDYSRTSLIARLVRDEIREIAPGLYLGIAYLDRIKTVNFVLSFPS